MKKYKKEVSCLTPIITCLHLQSFLSIDYIIITVNKGFQMKLSTVLGIDKKESKNPLHIHISLLNEGFNQALSEIAKFEMDAGNLAKVLFNQDKKVLLWKESPSTMKDFYKDKAKEIISKSSSWIVRKD